MRQFTQTQMNKAYSLLPNVVSQHVELTPHPHDSNDPDYYYSPCPFCGGVDRFRVYIHHKKPYPMYHCNKCDKGGDSVQFLKDKQGLDFVTAVKSLIGSGAVMTTAVSTTPKPKTRKNGRYTFNDDTNEKLNYLIPKAIDYLLNDDDAEPIRKWLANRGIHQNEIITWGIGYSPNFQTIGTDSNGKKVVALAGLWIPRHNNGVWTALNVYIPKKLQAKYGRRRMVRGSDNKSWYRGDRIATADFIFICEGELDTILLQRYLDALNFFSTHAHFIATTTGSANNIPDDLSQLAGKRVVICLDNDTAGKANTPKWVDALSNAGAIVTTTTPPHGKDITDSWKGMITHEVDLMDWLNGIIIGG